MNNNEIMGKYLPKDAIVQTLGNLHMFELPVSILKESIKNLYSNHNLPLKIITATDERKQGNSFKIIYVFRIPENGDFLAPFIKLNDGESFPSVVSIIHEASGYERRIKSFFGLHPEGHPLPNPNILHENWPADVFPLRKDFFWQTRPQIANTPYRFQTVAGEGVYEIPVGPVHAGIIEPGHFRFSVVGEEIVLLESRLGYKHKGIEKLFEILPMDEKLKLSERVSGDSSFSHSLAYCQAVESLAEIKVPERASYLRVVYAELERLANHFGDIGAIMMDAGFNFGGSHGARLREMIMQINEKITGSRFLRGANIVGGVTKDIPEKSKQELLQELDRIRQDFFEVIEIAKNSSSLLNRLRETGTLSPQIANDHGVIGVAGRAVGILKDLRINHPYAAYGQLTVNMASESGGCVNSRYRVRIKEVNSSFDILKEALEKMPAGKCSVGQKMALKKNHYALGAVEGWRGEIVYFLATDAEGNISRVEPRDPSFLNWTALGHAGKGNVVPDFPLINKSFNLSYSGNDL